MKMKKYTRISSRKRTIAFFLLGILGWDIASPALSFALTSGPTQPEAHQFQQVGVSDMVDLATGDFSYNIPLFNLPGPEGGYPFNLSYQSGVNMDQEASWVGLGWNINAGAINRNLRGLPDEFAGGNDKVSTETQMEPNLTIGGSMAVNVKLFGADYKKLAPGGNLGISTNVYWNNFKKWGMGIGLSPSLGFKESAESKNNFGFSMNFSLDSQEGVGANANLSYTRSIDKYKTEETTNQKGYRNLRTKITNYKAQGSVGIGYNSNSGLNMSISGTLRANASQGYRTESGISDEGEKNNSISGGSVISFANSFSTPGVTQEIFSENFTGNFSIGPGTNGSFPYFNFSGYYSKNTLKRNSENLEAYGYMNLSRLVDRRDKHNNDAIREEQKETSFVSDIAREDDGEITKWSPNLPTPSLSYDYFNISGQGVGGTFRPHRSDYGPLMEAKRKSDGVGGSLGLDLGIPGHYGVGGSVNYSDSKTGNWDDNTNPVYEKLLYRQKGFKTPGARADFEEYAFRLASEQVAVPKTFYEDFAGSIFTPVRFAQNAHSLKPELQNSDNTTIRAVGNNNYRNMRIPRGAAIMAFTNSQVMRKDYNTGRYEEILGEYNIGVYPSVGSSSLQDYSQDMQGTRGKNVSTDGKKWETPNHIAGFTVTDKEGKRYVYALPAYNNKQQEVIFSIPKQSTTDGVISLSGTDHNVEGTDKFLHKKTTSRYPHSFLITSVLGANYVDSDNVPGPSKDDQGYWVKFNYAKAASNYKWREPFSGYQHSPGSATTERDDKASYVYGEKEIWYLSSVETSTHIAYFIMDARSDGKGPASAENGSLSTPGKDSQTLYKLSRIELYAKEDKQALQTVHFEYEYLLCPQSPNSNASNAAKLTLTRVYFTYKNDRSGELSDYRFYYGDGMEDPGQTGQGSSQNYVKNKLVTDRWGTFTSEFNTGSVIPEEFPYTPQFNRTQTQTAAVKETFRQLRARDVSTWDLKRIKLPSGANIYITYESDDYAYVQHKKAMQMFQVEGIETPGNFEVYTKDDNDWTNAEPDAGRTGNTREKRRLIFKLENPIDATLSASQAAEEVYEQYFSSFKKPNEDGYKPLFAKLNVKFRGQFFDYVEGYYDLETDPSTGKPYVGVLSNTASIDGQNSYIYGFVTLDYMTVKKKVGYHPVAVAAWQSMRINSPELITSSADYSNANLSSDMDKLAAMGAIGGMFNNLVQVFKGYRNYCFGKEYANAIDGSKSIIRLDSPDGFKYGGGSRVKQVLVKDDAVWGGEEIGQTYEYTTTGADRNVISSGVASYEPVFGGEENPWRSPKRYTENLPLKTDNSLYFEEPANESYFPAPRVVYSKVTVTSLNTKRASEALKADPGSVAYKGVSLTGRTVHEFYTAKDFPVILEETTIFKKGGKPSTIPLPFVGSVTTGKFTATQGYLVRLNDMHGRQKSVSTFASAQDGQFASTPDTYVKYNYRSQNYSYRGENVLVLDSEVDVLSDDPLLTQQSFYTGNTQNVNARTEKMYLGVDYDFFMDFRRFSSYAGNFGLDFNMDIVGAGVVGFPLPFPWPSVASNKTVTKFAVTNKVVSQSGILESVVATDAQSTVTTSSLVFDPYTGQPLVTSVNNNYDNIMYNYSMPAHIAYPGMGPAYKNEQLEFISHIEALKDGVFELRTSKPEYPAAPVIYHLRTPMRYYDMNRVIASPLAETFDIKLLYSFLEEGDEFILEVLPTIDKGKADYFENASNSKGTAILIGKSLSFDDHCNFKYNLRFKLVKPYGMTRGNMIRFTLSRSGKRNLLGTPAGSVQTLDAVNTTPSLAYSPLMNRSIATRPGYSTTGVRNELAAFLNDILTSNGKLKTGNYRLDDPFFRDEHGEIKYPVLYNALDMIAVTDNCGANNECKRSGPGTSQGYQWTAQGPVIGQDYIYPVYDNAFSATYVQLLNQIMSNTPGLHNPLTTTEQEYIELQFKLLVIATLGHKFLEGYTFRYAEVFTPGPCLEDHCGAPARSTELWPAASHPDRRNFSGKKDVEGNPVHRGYHLVVRFKPGMNIQNYNAEDCFVFHGLAIDKFSTANGIATAYADTKISAVTTNASDNKTIYFDYSYPAGDNTQKRTSFCIPDFIINAAPKVVNIKNVLSISAAEFQNHGLHAGNASINDDITAYYPQGKMGIWRPVRNYYYKDERFQGVKPSASSNMHSMVMLKKDGVFDGTVSSNVPDFYTNMFVWKKTLDHTFDIDKWLKNETVTDYNSNLEPRESRNVLGIYSSVKFDALDMLPVAVGQNMRYKEWFYEDFDNVNSITFNPGPAQKIGVSMTGKMALSIAGLQPVLYKIPKEQLQLPEAEACVISMWAGGFNSLYSPAEIDTRFPNIMNIKLRFLNAAGSYINDGNGSPVEVVCRPKGKLYEGNGTFWRKIETEFTVPAGTRQLEISFGATGNSIDNNTEYGTMFTMLSSNGSVFLDQRACYDDIRIYPADGVVKSYVYDARDKKLLAESDENNFPSYYGYSPAGALYTVKKLTEEGLKTLKEIQSSTKRQ